MLLVSLDCLSQRPLYVVGLTCRCMGNLQGMFEHPPRPACNAALLAAVKHKCLLLILHCVAGAAQVRHDCQAGLCSGHHTLGGGVHLHHRFCTVSGSSTAWQASACTPACSCQCFRTINCHVITRMVCWAAAVPSTAGDAMLFHIILHSSGPACLIQVTCSRCWPKQQHLNTHSKSEHPAEAQHTTIGSTKHQPQDKHSPRRFCCCTDSSSAARLSQPLTAALHCGVSFNSTQRHDDMAAGCWRHLEPALPLNLPLSGRYSLSSMC